ncbi:RNase adapter RapZ [Alphaproteobacteria bacterium]|nr:RNase adapter RapZ [Alphaproteobacteria bacterium]
MNASSSDIQLVLVTGVSGAGNSTALKILEDSGWVVVDNLPLALIDPLIAMEVETAGRKLAIGLDARTSGFDVGPVKRLVENVRNRLGTAVRLVFLTASPQDLSRRYNATRRQHPLAQKQDLKDAIDHDAQRMHTVAALADISIDTTGLAPADLRRQLLISLDIESNSPIPVKIQSFSYRYGVPETADIVLDMRFAHNPHWAEGLRVKTGMDEEIDAFLKADESVQTVITHFKAMLMPMLERMSAEGRAQISIAFGCTGGKHRSVWAAEYIRRWLEETGHTVSLIHRELHSRAQ